MTWISVKIQRKLKPSKGQFCYFLPLWSFKNAFLWLLNEPSWPGYIAKCCKSLRTNTIYNANSIQQTKPKKTAKNLLFGTLDHSKMHFLTFEWSSMSLITAKLLRPFSIIRICNIKLMWRTKLEKTANKWMDHSKWPTRHRKKNLKICFRFFPDMRFSRGVQKKSEFSF